MRSRLVEYGGAGADRSALDLLHARRGATPQRREIKRAVACRMRNRTRGPVCRKRKLATRQDSTIPLAQPKMLHRTRR